MPNYEVLSPQVVCPTCTGAGYVRRDSRAEYVALIPLTDRRLRPRRICLKLFGSVVICSLVFTLLLIFLFPRTIYLRSSVYKLITVSAIANMQDSVIDLTVINQINVSNPNFVPATVNKVIISPKYRSVDLQETVNNSIYMLPLRSETLLNVSTKLRFEHKHFDVIKLCFMKLPYFHDIYVTFTFHITYMLLWQSFDAYLTIMPLVDCYPTNINSSMLMVSS
ncbi:Transmembrane protein 106A [Schistosoma japonicum]|nr:Transmembrane protein 106A [Schistosoma japonicum]